MRTSAIVYVAIASSCLACSQETGTLQSSNASATRDAGMPSDGETRHFDATTASFETATDSEVSRAPNPSGVDCAGCDAGGSNGPIADDEPFGLDTQPLDAGARTVPRPFGTVPRNTAAEPNGEAPSRDAGSTTEGEEPRPALGTRNFACQPSKSPMFQSRAPLQMHISGDFTRVNAEPNRDDAVSPGLLDPDGPGPLDAVPVQIRARGKLRYLACGYRPFKVVFEEKQKDNVFRKLGKSVKFSTHCGDRVDMEPVLQAPNLNEYYQRVRMEHAAYQIVATLETPSLETRLVELTYHDTATDQEETHLAFVREPEDEMAERCNLVEGEDIPPEPAASTNQRAELLLFLLNNFILQADVKNKVELRDIERRESVFAPYDFDLVGIFRRDFFKLKGRTLEENNVAFGDWLRRNQSPVLFEEVALLIGRRDVMRAIIDDAGLDPSNQTLFDDWFTLFFATLERFAGCREPSNAADVACHVPDDYPASISEAPVLTPGEHQVSLEPPGDDDVVGVELEGNRLYSFVTRTPAQLIDASGQLLETVPEAEYGAMNTTFSFTTADPATYHVEFSHGSSLVCSDMWANDLNAQYHAWALYADDHANISKLATPIAAGSTVSGTWEPGTLQDVFDEDWFRVEVGDKTTLTLKFQGGGAGSIDSFAEDAPEQAVGYVDLFPPVADTIDLADLFPGPGSYLVRILQSFGQGTYVLESN